MGYYITTNDNIKEINIDIDDYDGIFVLSLYSYCAQKAITEGAKVYKTLNEIDAINYSDDEYSDDEDFFDYLYGDSDDDDDDDDDDGGHIVQLQQLRLEELYALTNQGSNNTGFYNTGDNNRGNHNRGNKNIGSHNEGDENVGNQNKGTGNSGNKNIGSHNEGDENTGNYNVGDNNYGNNNRGSNNHGDNNCGDNNRGDNNRGFYNAGNGNQGAFNRGNRNQGAFNHGTGNSGWFSKPSSKFDWDYEDFVKSTTFNLTAELIDSVNNRICGRTVRFKKEAWEEITYIPGFSKAAFEKAVGFYVRLGGRAIPGDAVVIEE